MFRGPEGKVRLESGSVLLRFASLLRPLAAERNSHSSCAAESRPVEFTENALNGAVVGAQVLLANQSYAGFIPAHPRWIRRCADLYESEAPSRVHANTSTHGSPLGSSRSGSRSHRTCNSHSVPQRSSLRRPRRQVIFVTGTASFGGARDTDGGRESKPRYMGLTAG